MGGQLSQFFLRSWPIVYTPPAPHHLLKPPSNIFGCVSHQFPQNFPKIQHFHTLPPFHPHFPHFRGPSIGGKTWPLALLTMAAPTSRPISCQRWQASMQPLPTLPPPVRHCPSSTGPSTDTRCSLCCPTSIPLQSCFPLSSRCPAVLPGYTCLKKRPSPQSRSTFANP